MSKHSSRGTDWQRIRLSVLDRDNHQCAYCGREATEVDHIVAKANGGTDTLSNLVAACKPCNGRKSDHPLIRNNWYNKRWLTNV